MRVPVLNQNREPQMPCSNRRAYALMKKGAAKPFYQKGIFCIMLTRDPSAQERQSITLGIDPGSKREGYTAITKKDVIINITSNTPYWVKAHMETRRNLRRVRRQRKTPYRKKRVNRSSLRNKGLPPSAKARWDAKLRVVRLLIKLLPITHITVEDIKAITKEGKKKWNISFSPIETGKKYFYEEIKKLIPNLVLFEGHQTKQHRDKRGFKKSRDKLSFSWDAHNVDSHSLAEMALLTSVKPDMSMYKLEFLEYHRRQLHVQNPRKKNGYRKPYGTTTSLGLSRGSVVRATFRKKKKDVTIIGYIGGSSNRLLTINNLNGDRQTQAAKKENIKILYISKFIIQYLPFITIRN